MTVSTMKLAHAGGAQGATRLHPTKNDLPEDTRRAMISLLNRNLASAIHLGLQAKHAHWNVRGPDFFQLHELFDKVHAETGPWVDDLAERVVQLGGVAEGTLPLVVERTVLPADDLSLTTGAEHVAALSNALSAFGASVREAIDTADEAGDMNTADLFTEVSRGVDKMLWFVEAHSA